LLHPLAGIDHLIAMLAVGLWGAQRGGRAVWMLPVTFPLIMVVGGVMGIAGVWIPAPEVGVAMSMVVLGLAIFFEWKPAEYIMLFPIAVFAIFHGWAHGAELPNEANPAAYAVGFVTATGSIHIAGVGLGLTFSRWLTRDCGAMIALAENLFSNQLGRNGNGY